MSNSEIAGVFSGKAQKSVGFSLKISKKVLT